MFSLDGRRTLVTGASTGIGRAMAGALAAAGAEVVLVARTPADLERAADEIGERASWTVADVGDEGQIDHLCGQVGDIDIVVNAAGVNLRPPMRELTTDDWATTMAVNLTAPFLLGQRLAPGMVERGWGRILHVGSQQSWRAFGNSGGYGASKAGLLGLTRSQAEAWSPAGVTVNCVIPGFVRTAMTERIFVEEPERAEALAARTMVGRNGTPGDFAGIAVFLCSDAAAFVTGQAIAVDGGFSAT
ncbi:SDR family oxidoreductase [Acidimicrobiia bacterium EGI L10123]|uniref:SDR family NAD(P)-dependent oxidoreductase n=1 Tax=Salinilacustrithrix flava TaxID=2957203 RepID=UPI003D7C2BC4|nr:SDR family oxidoreductase [Acidimicrobiia bacterium EGI L10123]